jgi:flagellar biogenesis protein FliO
MNARIRSAAWIFCATSAIALAAAPLTVAQTHTAIAPAPMAQAPSEKDVADVQADLLHLLRLSPTMTAAVAADPSLLADQQYVTRNNPELAQFMASHPDIARNPEFYLFSKLDPSEGHRDKALQRVVWPDLTPVEHGQSQASAVMHDMVPIILFPVFFLAVVWVVRIFVDSRRWNRTFKQQSEIHSRLIEKLGTSQELVAYMETEAGKRFLMASPNAAGPESGQQMPNTVSRVLTSLSTGIVLALVGVGFLLLRNAGPDTPEPMLITGTLLLMPGLGFILSAGVTWVLARRLGLMPEKEVGQNGGAVPFGSQDRQ